MKTFIGLLILVIIFILTLYLGITIFRQKIDSALSAQPVATVPQPTPTPTSPAARSVAKTLFVPYWSLDTGVTFPHYQTLVYFGVPVGKNGLDKNDDGYQKLETFTSVAGLQRKILTVRMIDSTTNFATLKDQKQQTKVIQETISLAKANKFDGVLLNIEVSALPFASLVDQITDFSAAFAKQAHASNLEYSITAYGDTFYRIRPFDIQKLAKDADHMYIMAYDFHKAKGNPGPNFPLRGSEAYGYDYSRMISSFADAVPIQNLIVVFGMYGYDWSVDEQGVPKVPGKPVSLKEIRAEIIDHCEHLSCSWERDTASAEVKAVYSDGEGERHIVWFEDEESVKRKQEFLKKSGIGSFAYWAYSYF